MKSPLYVATSLTLVLSISALSQTAVPSSAAGPAQQLPVNASNRATVHTNYGKLPLSFEANQGQSDPQVKFLSRGQGYSLFLTDSAAVLVLTKGNHPNKKLDQRPAAGKTQQPDTPKTDVVRMELAGANPAMRVSGAEQLPGKANYFIGNDPSKWHSNLPTYAKVKYAAVYPGVDLLYYGNQRQLEYDFVVAPGADPSPVRLHFAGASKLKLNAEGDLTIIAKDGEIAFHKPVVYQTKDGRRQPVEGNFELLAGNRVGFKVGDYDHDRELVIDPTLAYSTYLGGSGLSMLAAIAVDSEGSVYATGASGGAHFPTTPGTIQPDVSTHIFVSKLNPAGSALVYSTYMGGTSSDAGDETSGIAVDENGDAYLAGQTGSPDFPVTASALQRADKNATIPGRGTGFVTKLNPSGSALEYSTYLGGSSFDLPSGIALDSDGNTYIVGQTGSLDYPVTEGALQTVNHVTSPSATGFITKLNSTGTGLIYSTLSRR